ncbi:E3 ubiquitin ligase BIG BROTHER-related-like isoform X2 [Dioscorea cayenensis subsp. rotundata]|uniref:E3 ubiquitin ligase BIG BROTHER-related-like isoform X2 n=1 Tax=Dioscorea cayennensis subsp. rotundata TaxID=55577 RepID=A0AB40CGT8_DIOCR|nr:E3 ubiquitin ligase BIG BROTHER-related-like isoform X2 [Dioscorea cayenensis subsp. rotundata]
MENSNELSAGAKSADQNPNTNAAAVAGDGDPAQAVSRPTRTPFTNLSQVDADLALARTLQEQEAAYLMLMSGRGISGDYASSVGSYEDGGEFDVHDHEEGSEYEEEYEEDEFVEDGHLVDPADFDSDEAYARALQDAEEQEIAARLMAFAGLNDWGVEHHRAHHAGNPRDAWQDVDPDELSYEELVALGEVVGTESRGLSADTIASLPSVGYKAESAQDGDTDPCIICRMDYEDGDSLVVLSCKHAYHSDCINKWLQINKLCPVCSTEVSTSENGQQA